MTAMMHEQSDFDRFFMTNQPAPATSSQFLPERRIAASIDRLFFRGCGCQMMPGNMLTLPDGRAVQVTRIETVTGGNMAYFDPVPYVVTRPAQNLLTAND